MPCAPVCRAPPRQKMTAPIRIASLRPSQSPRGPATKAPKNPPPVKSATIAPLEKSVADTAYAE